MVRGKIAVTKTKDELVNEDLTKLYIDHINQSVMG